MHVKIAVAMRPTDANVLCNAACAYGVLGMKAETFRRAIELLECELVHERPRSKSPARRP